MAYQQKPNYFSLFVNDKKTKDTQPDWKGSITLPNGDEFWFDAWNKTSSSGNAFISGKIGNLKQQQTNAPASYAPFPATAPAPGVDDDIPF